MMKEILKHKIEVLSESIAIILSLCRLYIYKFILFRKQLLDNDNLLAICI